MRGALILLALSCSVQAAAPNTPVPSPFIIPGDVYRGRIILPDPPKPLVQPSMIVNAPTVLPPMPVVVVPPPGVLNWGRYAMPPQVGQ